MRLTLIVVLLVIACILFGATTLTNGGQVFKAFATHPDVPPTGGLLIWAKTDGTFQTTNSVGTDSAMGGASSGGPQVMGGTTVSAISLNGGAGTYGPASGPIYLNPFESLAQQAFSTAGTISKLCGRIGYTDSQPSTGSLVFMLRKNTADTAVTVIFPASSTSPQTICDNTHTVTVQSGDLISVQITNNATSAAAYFAGYSYLFQ